VCSTVNQCNLKFSATTYSPSCRTAIDALDRGRFFFHPNRGTPIDQEESARIPLRAAANGGICLVERDEVKKSGLGTAGLWQYAVTQEDICVF
jgi:hypothetical protein